MSGGKINENRESKNDQAQLHQKLAADLRDLAVVVERHAEEPISFEEMKKRLKEDGTV